MPTITQIYNAKTIGIINADTIIGKVLLRKILIHLGSTLTKLIIIHTRGKSKPHTGDKANSHFQFKGYEGMFRDGFMAGVGQALLRDKVEVVGLEGNGLASRRNIDILFNCHQPQDLTRNTLEFCLASHVWKSNSICESLATNFKITKLITLSSLYTNNFGYVSESDTQQNIQPLGYSPQQIISPSKLLQDLSDIFSTDFQIWQWSVLYMENIFASKTMAQKIEIVRVPLIGPTLEDYEGYVMGWNTLTSLVFQIGKKNIEVLQGNAANIVDMIPADFVANYMVVIGGLEVADGTDPQQDIGSGNMNKIPRIIVHNLSTSSRNPISLLKFCSYISQAWIQYSGQDYKAPKIRIHQKKWQRKAYSIKCRLPNTAKSRLAHILEIKQWKIESQQNTITTNKKLQTIRKYRYFFQHQWICQSNKSIDYFSALASEDQYKFNFNVNTINWKTYAKLCCYAISKYLVLGHVEKFNPMSLDLLSLQRSTYFSDIFWALTEGKSIKTQTSVEIKNYILSTKSVKEAINQLVEEKTNKLEQTPTAYQKVEEEFYKVADEMCTQMFSQYSMKSIRGFAWFLHKLFRTIYQKVVVDKAAIMKLRNHDEKTNGPLIIIPTHRSYIDFLIMSYVFFGYGIKVPHIAAAEDFLNMAVVHILLRKSGAFFIKRNQKKYRNLYKAVMTQYISKLLSENHYLEFFIEGTRSRVGKMLDPKFGILSIVARNVLDGKIPDARILPVTINYEKVLEGTSFTYEMMGQTKVKQSLSRLIKAADVIKQNYGRIYIQLCQQISIKSYFQSDPPTKKFQQTLSRLGYKITHSLTNSLVITPPAILASIILMQRIGISDDRLSQKSQWLSRQITSRGIKVARTQSDSSISISNTLILMGDVVNKSKKDMFQVQVSVDQNSFMQLFTLVYYRNTLTHIFFQEALVAVSIASFGFQEMTNLKIPIQNLKSAVTFLSNLLKKQYVLEHSLTETFPSLLSSMQAKGIIKQNPTNPNLLGIQNTDSNIFMFYCSLIWPVAQSYWICVLYIFKLLQQPSTSMDLAKLQSQIQWFGQSIFTDRIILHLQAISMDTIKNATSTLKNMGIIGEVGDQRHVKVLVGDTVLKGLEKKLETFLKAKYASSFKGTLGNGRGTVALDFPFLSKL